MNILLGEKKKKEGIPPLVTKSLKRGTATRAIITMIFSLDDARKHQFLAYKVEFIQYKLQW